MFNVFSVIVSVGSLKYEVYVNKIREKFCSKCRGNFSFVHSSLCFPIKRLRSDVTTEQDRHLHVTFVATLGLRNQLDFDPIPVWVIRHIYFENELVLPRNNALIYCNLFLWNINLLKFACKEI